MANPNEKRFYGRRKSRPLKGQRAEAYNALLPELCVDEGSLNEDHSLPPSSLFENPGLPIWLEIGFGNGERLAEQMRRDTDINFIGIEPYIDGMGAFLKDIAKNDKSRIRVFDDDAMMVANSLQAESLDGIYILNPDPWHKKRHHKRRIVSAENLDVFANILKPGGDLILSTDVPYLTDWMVTKTLNHPAFEWQARRAEDWRTPPKGWIHTAYEGKKAKGADKMSYLLFKRRAA